MNDDPRSDVVLRRYERHRYPQPIRDLEAWLPNNWEWFENSHVEGAEVGQRVQQVVARVLTGNGELAAVSTAVPRTILRLMQPTYYYRCFIGAAGGAAPAGWTCERAISAVHD